MCCSNGLSLERVHHRQQLQHVGRVRALRLGLLAGLEGDGMERASVVGLLEEPGADTMTASSETSASRSVGRAAVPGTTSAAPAPTSARRFERVEALPLRPPPRVQLEVSYLTRGLQGAVRGAAMAEKRKTNLLQ